MSETVKRLRGLSPRGEFEQSKKVALATIEERLVADRSKSATLKAARLARMQCAADPDGDGVRSR